MGQQLSRRTRLNSSDFILEQVVWRRLSCVPLNVARLIPSAR